VTASTLPSDIAATVALALAEDRGTGDATAALIAPDRNLAAEVIARENAILCGVAWFDEVFAQLDDAIRVQWLRRDGDPIERNTVVCRLRGPAATMLSGERTALNFLQTLSGTATATSQFVIKARGTRARILDTRKTLPGLRTAQKYAVRCGGGHNHRQGLFDAILIKENHIAALGTIAHAVEQAKAKSPSLLLEVEVETVGQLREALDTQADRLMLDDFSLDQLREAVTIRDAHPGPRKDLEASGGIDLDTVRAVAETGVDWISIGSMTKHLHATDYSMRFV
jgi:nicotinate-nucleotide pyrophosphorylase (carboxylating)